jgi:tetratricopeptide (TPR) repeat protein
MRSILLRAVLVLTFAGLSAEAFAQRGAIRGKVVDEEGKPVEGVECRVELSGGGGRESTVTTKDSGQFVKNGVPAGTYTITCDKEGYRRLSLATQVSGFEQSDLGQHVLYRLAPGELSEAEHARATELLDEFKSAATSDDHQATLDSLFELAKMLPDNPEITFNIAGTYEKMGDDAKAIEYYTKTAELKPDFYDAWTAIADIQGRLKKWAEASEAASKALALKDTDPIFVFNSAVYAQNGGDTDTAKARYEKALELDPKRVMAYYQLGLIAVSKGANDEALAHFQKFVELAPDDPQAKAAQDVIDALKAKSSQP